MDKEKIIKITNRNLNSVGYSIPELGVERQFTARETKEIPFKELERLSFIPGGDVMIKNYLIVKDEEAIKALGIKVEPEYFYTEEDVKRLLEKGSLNEFLDCLDFAPDGVLDMIKDLSVSLPLNDMSKREIILNKLNFNVTRAIEIKNTKFDDGEEDTTNFGKIENTSRRAAVPVASEAPTRRTAAPKYKVVTTTE